MGVELGSSNPLHLPSMMSYTQKDFHTVVHQPASSPRDRSWSKSSGNHFYSPVYSAGHKAPETSRAYHRAADEAPTCYSNFRTASNGAYETQNDRRLPGLNELFASKVLIAPGTGSSQEGAVDQAGLPPLRKSSVSSSGHGSPLSASTTFSNPESYTDSEPETQRNLAIRTAPGAVRNYSPSSSAAAFGKDGNFQPIRTDSVVDTCDPVYNSVWPSTAALYADPEFKPSGAGFTAEYKGIKSVPGFGNYHVYEGGFCIPTHIDGEAVNPVWGLTKSKNPRKRLPIACGWCRRKKIRCEPSGEGCLQCKKAKRQCEMYVSRDDQSTWLRAAN